MNDFDMTAVAFDSYNIMLSALGETHGTHNNYYNVQYDDNYGAFIDRSAHFEEKPYLMKEEDHKKIVCDNAREFFREKFDMEIPDLKYSSGGSTHSMTGHPVPLHDLKTSLEMIDKETSRMRAVVIKNYLDHSLSKLDELFDHKEEPEIRKAVAERLDNYKQTLSDPVVPPTKIERKYIMQREPLYVKSMVRSD